jgi:hypothetical protein
MIKYLGIAAMALALSTGGAAAQQAAMRAVALACRPDIARFCATVQPGNGRIKACMKAHMQELSDPCKEAMFQAWLKK